MTLPTRSTLDTLIPHLLFDPPSSFSLIPVSNKTRTTKSTSFLYSLTHCSGVGFPLLNVALRLILEKLTQNMCREEVEQKDTHVTLPYALHIGKSDPRSEWSGSGVHPSQCFQIPNQKKKRKPPRYIHTVTPLLFASQHSRSAANGFSAQLFSHTHIWS